MPRGRRASLSMYPGAHRSAVSHSLSWKAAGFSRFVGTLCLIEHSVRCRCDLYVSPACLSQLKEQAGLFKVWLWEGSSDICLCYRTLLTGCNRIMSQKVRQKAVSPPSSPFCLSSPPSSVSPGVSCDWFEESMHQLSFWAFHVSPGFSPLPLSTGELWKDFGTNGSVCTGRHFGLGQSQLLEGPLPRLGKGN